MPPFLRRARLRVPPSVWAVGCALVIGPSIAVRPVGDLSPWLHLRVGDWLLAGHRFGSPDPWAPFAAHAFIPTQWLPSMITAKAVDWWGMPAVAWERGVGIALMALLLVTWLSTLARLWVAVACAAAALFAAWPSLTERPQLAGFVLLVPVIAAWWSTAQDQRPRWWLVPLTWVAASSHGVWAVGGALGAVVTVALVLGRLVDRVQAARLVGLLLACAVAGALTPVGPRLLLTPFEVGSQGRQFVQEWLPSSVRSPHVAVVLVMLALAWVIWIRTGRRTALPEVCLFLFTIGLTLYMQRTVAIAAIVAAGLAAAAAEDLLSRRGRMPPFAQRGATALWCLCALAGIGIAAPVSAARAQTPAHVPTELAVQIRGIPDGTRILVDGDTSGWLLYTAPELKPVFDVRIEVYAPEHVRRFIATMAAEPGWEKFISDTGAQTALVKQDSAISAALQEQLRWQAVGTDAGLVLLEAPR